MRLHLLTSEYPPDPGGVSDYSCLVAHGLAARGHEVIIWSAGFETSPRFEADGRVKVWATLGRFRPTDLTRTGRLLGAEPRPRRLLVQWVPHGFGLRAVNVPFAFWLWRRARVHGDRLELMVHEGGLPFARGKLLQNLAAIAQRLMIAFALNAASRVWISNPRWERRLRPFGLGRDVIFTWLPVPSNVPVAGDAASVQRVRRAIAPRNESIVGHFGTYASHTTEYLDHLAPALHAAGAKLLLLGIGSDQYADSMVARQPSLRGTVTGSGALTTTSISAHLAACDLMAQPYPDGVSGRRGSAMAALAHGRAIISTRGEFTEVEWLDGEPVRTVPAGDPAAYTRAVIETLKNGAELSRLSKAALRLYAGRFDIVHTLIGLSGETAMASDQT